MMEFDPREHAKQVLARQGITASEAEIERMAAFIGPAPAYSQPALATEPQLVQVPERWR